MNTATIEKSIELLNSSKLDELRELLAYERQKSILAGQGKKSSLLTAVKKFIDNNDLKTTRPELAKIQHIMKQQLTIEDIYLKAESILQANAGMSLFGAVSKVMENVKTVELAQWLIDNCNCEIAVRSYIEEQIAYAAINYIRSNQNDRS